MKRGAKPRRREVAWSPKLAYAIGLIATDGCLSNDGRHLTLVSKDREQLRNLQACLGLKVKIGLHRSGYTKANTSAHRVQWGDVVLYRFLEDIGLMPDKSKRLGALLIPDEYFFDFLRGSFDGDGSFYSYFDPRWKKSFMFYLSFISASKKHTIWIQKTIKRLSGVKGHFVFVDRQGGEVYSVRYAKKETLAILAKMYTNKRVTCLSRKRLKIVRALRIVGKSLPGYMPR